MNPDTNRFESLHNESAEGVMSRIKKHSDAQMAELTGRLLRPDGTPVPEHWSVFTVGEHVVVKGYTFKAAYLNETTIVLEPVGPVLVGGGAEVAK